MLNRMLKLADTIAIGGHVRPDGDCIGSSMGLCRYIKENYSDKEVDVYLEEIPEKYRFIKETENVKFAAPEGKVYDLFISLDCADLERLGFSVPLFEQAAHTLCIDHHVSNPGYAQENHIVPEASSTSELVYRLVDKDKLSREAAEALYAGIVNDTGAFQYSCTSPATLRAAAELLEAGVDAPGIIRDTF